MPSLPSFQGQLQFNACESCNEVPTDAIAQAESFLQQAMIVGMPEFEAMIRVAIGKSYKEQGVSAQRGDRVTATITPFIYASQLPASTFEQLIIAIVQHQDRAKMIELLGTEASAIMALIDQPQRWPIGFFACTEELIAEDGRAVQSQLIPYVVSACQLDCCLHLPDSVRLALQSDQAKRWHTERPGRLLVSPVQSVWRPLQKDHELDDQTRAWIVNHPDCLIVTAFDKEKANSYLIAEPFR